MIKNKSVRYIFFVIAFLTIFMTAYNFYYIYPSFKDLLVKNTENEASRLGKHLAGMYLKDDGLLSMRSIQNFDERVEVLITDFNLMKLKLFSPEGFIIYSTDKADIGQVNEHDYFRQVIARGKTYTKVVRKNTESLEGQMLTADVVETYVPVMSGSKFMGAFEMYYDITDKNLELSNVMNKTVLITVIMLICGISLTTIMMIRLDKSIQEQKKTEMELKIFSEKLHQSNKELESFAHIASHDLQEPLRKVTAFGDRLKTKYADALGDQGCDYLERMQNACTRMQHLINGLMLYSRVTTKAQPFVPVDLSNVVKEVLSDLEVRIQDSGGRVEVDELPTVSADPLQMRQLFQNLIGNALKFTKEGDLPIVKVSAASVQDKHNTDKKGFYQFTIEDNGIGFEEQYADRIFGVFQRLHGRSAYEGSGIGLSVCKKIVERHGGTIAAKSAPGKGAAFIFNLRAEQPEKQKTAESTTLAEPSSC